ncbi:cell wall synthesis protein [Decorospora gaudefroyi]|uniref:Cell wall synthesis protein n=1 Tax=Decorospora gaudefroyi TaxID=184978 RepID=A0A6A5K883_9PLEO|nr:cell wall synthesis protein [Decorospora gaudefroyi]
MKFQYIVTGAALAAVTAAKPHHIHRRAHAHGLDKRAAPDAIVYAPAATETKIIYWLDDHAISEEEVRQGIANGTLMWGDDGVLSTSTDRPVALPTPLPISKEEAQPAKSVSELKVKEPAPAKPKPTEEPKPEQPEPQRFAPPTATPARNDAPTPSWTASPVEQHDVSSTPWAGLIDKEGHCAECHKVFPNGTIPCTEFPYGYGALPISHEGLGGWSGIQDPQYAGADGFDDITTVVKGSCSDGTCCTTGSFCSYGCPNPYLKASFPSIQGRTGQTVGGLYCNQDGFLEMADGSIADTLCVEGSKRMTVKVHNKLSKSVSFCRTDYPGTESMTFPLTVGPGETGFLANPDLGAYFFWEGKATSAQYYVNKQGVPENEACTWGEIMKGKGNWSPTVFGTSWDDLEMHVGFSSLWQNPLCDQERLNYDITFMGDGVVAPCSYKQATHEYCQGDKCSTDPLKGCTASVGLGRTLTIVLSDG